MVKFSNKPKAGRSKRQKLSKKYKIEKKVKQHHRKLKKEARKMTALGMAKKSTLLPLFLPRSLQGPRNPQSLSFQKASR